MKNPPHRLILALTGRSHTGKDTVALMIEKYFPHLTRAAFGDALKRAYDAKHHTHTLIDMEERDQHRAGLIALQEEWYRKDPNCWSRVVLSIPGAELLTFPRLPEEVEAARQAGAVLLRITASPETLTKRMGEDYQRFRHDPTEESLDNYPHWDYIITNDGTLAELEEKVYAVAQAIKK